ncbi:TIGR01244 family phosphatase [Porphyrobacter algicida]|uniref:TIGR01244 family phosphatase n=1 Tax=Qipengyuania algicida TaxID=1836209 RepID=A0A845AKQ8_9SPHN|nr:TIGR01244 family sulfur transferase [Qipengyuania algicida]MXP29126.1 TIGR01244 family phosphatase [Qipengyuania algicida]
MNARKLDDTLSVNEQLTTAEIPAAAEQGFAAIINNRPDGEEPGQPSSAEVEAAARDAGLEYRYVPFVPGQLTPGIVENFRTAATELPGPILAFCRSGTRSTTLWAAANADRLGVDRVIKVAANAGYDLSGARPFLENMAR